MDSVYAKLHAGQPVYFPAGSGLYAATQDGPWSVHLAAQTESCPEYQRVDDEDRAEVESLFLAVRSFDGTYPEARAKFKKED